MTSRTLMAWLRRAAPQAARTRLTLLKARVRRWALPPNLAEAMLAETPVVATGWSGKSRSHGRPSWLLPFALTPVRDCQGLCTARDAHWADPDIDAAAQALRDIADDADGAWS